ncbi:hypothetical protein GF318_02735 [Candidatus Micrarchaeota archaeon]|nr:hypothetical protein [Candidatus Micrarchaeota archaeon]
MKPIIELGPKILTAFRKRNQSRLRKLNDEVLKAAALESDRLSFKLAVFSYVLAKIVSKPRFLKKEYSGRLKTIEDRFAGIVRRARGAKEKEMVQLFSKLEKAVIALEKEDPRFLLDLVSKGRLKMAATFYAQGMSLGTAAEMTNLDKQEILDYAGKTMMFDRVEEKISISERMKTARKMIGE